MQVLDQIGGVATTGTARPDRRFLRMPCSWSTQRRHRRRSTPVWCRPYVRPASCSPAGWLSFCFRAPLLSPFLNDRSVIRVVRSCLRIDMLTVRTGRMNARRFDGNAETTSFGPVFDACVDLSGQTQNRPAGGSTQAEKRYLPDKNQRNHGASDSTIQRGIIDDSEPFWIVSRAAITFERSA